MIYTYVHIFSDGTRCAVRYDCRAVSVRIANLGDFGDMLIMKRNEHSDEFKAWVRFVMDDFFPKLTEAQLMAGQQKNWIMDGFTGEKLNK